MTPPGWQVPDWPAPEGVHAICTVRSGGASQGPYRSLNLGGHVGDRPGDVEANRARLQDAIGARPVFLNQVHGVQMLPLRAGTPDGGTADACTTTESRIACTIMVADCLPVLLTDATGVRVAAAHAGWRGLAAGVLEASIESFEVDEGAGKVMAWLGPCIGPEAFEVGEEVKAAFEAFAPEARLCFRPAGRDGKWLADLAGLARQRLRALGVTRIYGNDGSRRWCTVNNPLLFFSHRRDGVSGRFAACIWRD